MTCNTSHADDLIVATHIKARIGAAGRLATTGAYAEKLRCVRCQGNRSFPRNQIDLIGRAIVAVRFDREAALLMGIDVKRTYAITFALGGAMAGAAGSLLSVSFPISPLSGPLFLSKAFVICILGGVGSVPGAALGGLIFGMLESFGAIFFGSEYALTLSFVVLILLLLVRPHGLLGVKGF